MLLVMLCTLSLAQMSLAGGQEKDEKRDKDDPRARAAYLERKRTGGQATRALRLRAVEQVRSMREREGAAYWNNTQASTSSSNTQSSGAAQREQTTTPLLKQGQWVSIGPTPTNPTSPGFDGTHVSGRVTALVVDPNNVNTVYLGGAQGGVWKTTDAGAHWVALTDNQPSLATGSIAIDGTTNPSTVYVGTGEENFGSDSYYGAGILKSTDGGSSWTQQGASIFATDGSECTSTRFLQCGGARIGGIAIRPGTGGSTAQLLAVVQRGFSNSGGVYFSPNGGNFNNADTWTSVTSEPLTADSVVFIDANTALVGVDQNGVWKCAYSGTTPTCSASNGTSTNVISTTDTDRVSLAAVGTTVYAALAEKTNSTLSGLYKSTDGAANWTKLTVPDFCGGPGDLSKPAQATDQCFYDMLVAVNPMNANVVFVGGSGYPNAGPNTYFLYHSVDGGSSWTQDTNLIHADQHAAAFTPDGTTMYIGNDGGVYKTSTASLSSSSVTWAELNSTLDLTQFYGYFAIDPNISTITYAGAQDNGTQKFTNDTVWNELTCGDGASAVIDPNNTATVYVNCQSVDVRKSTSADNFGAFNSAGTGINTADNGVFIPPMVGDNSRPQIKLYFGTSKLYLSKDGAASWSAISTDLTMGGSKNDGISNIGISPDNDTVYAVTSNGHIGKVTGLNANAPSVTILTPSGNGFPSDTGGTQINGVAVVDANTAYITIPGFSPGNHIFKTTNGGSIWNNISANLPNTPVHDIVLDPDVPGTLYIATDVGVFVSANDGGTWQTLNTGLPNVAVFGLKLHRGSRTLRAATHGRGMWDMFIPACGTGPCISPSPTSLDFGSQPEGTTSAPQTIKITNIGGLSPSLVITNVDAGGDYSQTNNCGTVAQNGTCTIAVTFTPRAAFTRAGGVTIQSNTGKTTTINLTGTGIVQPANDNFANGATVTQLPYTATIVTNGATSEASDPIPAMACVTSYAPADPLGYDATVNHHSVWFFFTPGTSGNVDIDTLGSVSTYDTVISVWTGTPALGFTAVTSGCNDDANSTVKTSQITNMAVTAGTTYRILVTGYYAHDFGTLVFHIQGSASTPAGGPAVTINPSSLSYTTVIGRTSAPQPVTITNNTVSPISISSIGLSLGDYSLSQNCTGGSVGAGASCTAMVRFTPGALGQRNATMAITDTASGSPQMVPITGFGFDFGINLKRPSRSSRNGGGNGVVAGQKRSFQLTLSNSGAPGVIAQMDCTGAPAGATCTVSPAQVAFNGTSVPVTVTLTTSAAKASGRARRLRSSANPTYRDYNLQVNARVGDAVRTTVIPVAIENPR